MKKSDVYRPPVPTVVDEFLVMGVIVSPTCAALAGCAVLDATDGNMLVSALVGLIAGTVFPVAWGWRGVSPGSAALD